MNLLLLGLAAGDSVPRPLGLMSCLGLRWWWTEASPRRRARGRPLPISFLSLLSAEPVLEISPRSLRSLEPDRARLSSRPPAACVTRSPRHMPVSKSGFSSACSDAPRETCLLQLTRCTARDSHDGQTGCSPLLAWFPAPGLSPQHWALPCRDAHTGRLTGCLTGQDASVPQESSLAFPARLSFQGTKESLTRGQVPGGQLG